MKIELKIDDSCEDTKIIIVTNRITDEINELIKSLSKDSPPIIAGFKGNQLEVLDEKDIIRIYSSDGKVLASTRHGEYKLKLRLYELENLLDKHSFVRISNSEIINLKLAGSFDLSLSGTICVRMEDNTITYVSRRYVSKIKQILGI